MKEKRSMKIVAIGLIFLPLMLILFRLGNNDYAEGLMPDHKYVVEYRLSFASGQPFNITTFLPVNNYRQKVHLFGNEHSTSGTIFLEGLNKKIQWTGYAKQDTTLSYRFEFRGDPLVYNVDPELAYQPDHSEELRKYTDATSFIQSGHARIKDLARELAANKTAFIEVIRSFYDYVYNLPSSSSSELTDALMALDQGEASCNGKSRLFVALCRSMNIPSQVTGGIILEQISKKTSHLWAEVLINGKWVPFDALNGHFASLPDNYLELYKGDHFLITRNSSLTLDYLYVIEKVRVNDYPLFSALNVWELIDDAGIPQDMFRMLLLLPLGAFLVAISKNIIGLKTYGVFLPVLISLSLLETGLWSGLILLTVIILIVALLNFPLEAWGIQFNSKIASMLIAVVITALMVVKLLYTTGWLKASAPLFFPIIILTIVSERVARKIEEEGVKSSVELYLTTLLVTIFVYFILSSVFIQSFVLTFPEIIITLAGLNLFLGKWIGLRIVEYYRFYQLTNR